MQDISLKNRIKRKYTEIIWLLVYSLVCVSLSFFRIQYTGSKTFIFLNWNLFLAFVPWLLSSGLLIFPKQSKNTFVLIAVLGLWALFFPNTLYIITDLLHLKGRSWSTIWYDLILILSFAWVGILYGFHSLKDLEFILGRKTHHNFVRIGIALFLFITSFGIYLGRYLRWNSWDILNEPKQLMLDIMNRIINPMDHPRAWGMTILLGLFLNMVYWSISLFSKRNQRLN
ncbi:MAG: DUF1361 domain-containing protein [Flavobacteriales bacterium]|nr:DUF1361 domain-containing protein [Flavobacteriales bacterium]